ncbi:MAG: hypothetical protein GF330_00785, partial [Candidatus Eisenbacteria bacterium]|nr:hypothetical protein [Candidatus Eisenbacteria bacterium]
MSWPRWRWRGSAALLLALCIALGVFFWLPLHRPLNDDASPRAFRVAPGQSMRQIERALEEAELIAPSAPLALWARLRGADRRIQEGTYELSSALTPREILQRLVEGRRLLVTVTIPEGWRRAQIFARLAARLSIPRDSLPIAAACLHRELRLPEVPAALEGYLFPETYRFAQDARAREALRVLVEEGLRRRTPRRLARAEQMAWSWHAVLTLASIVEAET